MTDKEAMKLALEALEYIDDGANNQGAHIGISWRCVSTKAKPAITALKERLAQTEQEPVAKNDGGKITWLIDDWPQNCLLYTYPPKSFSYEQVKAHIRAASMSANDIVVGSDVTNDGVSIVIRKRDEILYAEFFAHPPQRTEHITDGSPCWCEPELDYKDPDTGAEVWIHRETQ
jgi:hypothetical protein